MRRFLPLALGAALALSATAAGAVEVANQASQNGSLVTLDLAPNSDLTNNGQYRSTSTAYLFDEGTNPGSGDHTFLLHFDRSGSVLQTGRVRGSFDFVLDPGELFTGVFSDYLELIATDDLSTGVQYQRSLVFGQGLAVTVFRGLEDLPPFLFGDTVVITPDQAFNQSAPTYHVSYDFRNDGATLDEVRFAFSAAVPEPGAWALMLGGFGLMGAALRRRRAAFA